MKKIISKCMYPVFGILLLTACGGDKKDLKDELKKDAKNALQNNPQDKPVENGKTDGPKNVMTIAEAIAYIKAADANKGQTITISAYPKGMTKAVNGEFMLYVSDKSGSGLSAENFACKFKEESKEKVKGYKLEDLVKVTGKINYNNGMIVMKDAVLAE